MAQAPGLASVSPVRHATASPAADPADHDLHHWCRASGVPGRPQLCLGPLPDSRAGVVRWSAREPDTALKTVQPHPGRYRIAVMLEPVESQIWLGGRPVWGGLIAANRFRICPPGPQQDWRRLSGCDIVNVFIPEATVQALAEQAGGCALTLGSTGFTPDRVVVELAWKMADAQRLAGALAPRFCDGLVQSLVAYLLQHYAAPADRQAAEAARYGALSHARLTQLKAFVAEHLHEPVANAELAALCCMSESHFAREFHRSVGLPPHRFVTRLRLERAQALLRDGRDTLAQVAEQCGFKSASHLSRVFAQHLGQPPGAWRARQAADAATSGSRRSA